MRRIVPTLAALVLTLDVLIVAGWIGPESGGVEWQDVAAAAEPAAPRSPATTTTRPRPTTTIPVAPPTTAAPVLSRPIDVPADPYFDEPVQTIGTIEIPAIGLRSAMGEGISLRNIDRGPSHWPGSALPGQPGNVVVAGHRSTHTRPFADIHRLEPGDEVFLDAGAGRFRYVVTGSQVVTPDQTEIAIQTPARTATLFACHPPGSTRYRYVVHLELAQG